MKGDGTIIGCSGSPAAYVSVAAVAVWLVGSRVFAGKLVLARHCAQL